LNSTDDPYFVYKTPKIYDPEGDSIDFEISVAGFEKIISSRLTESNNLKIIFEKRMIMQEHTGFHNLIISIKD
jgi:hypothetical protein